MTPYMSQISIFGFAYAPRGWALCDGALLAPNQQPALFALIGTSFGGNGTTNFALPDFRGRVPLGLGANNYSYQIGKKGGDESVMLNAQTMPAHDHELYAMQIDDTSTNTNEPADKILATSPVGKEIYNSLDSSTMKAMSPQAVSVNGSTQSHNNVQPSMVMNFCIALQGIFPPRQ